MTRALDEVLVADVERCLDGGSLAAINAEVLGKRLDDVKKALWAKVRVDPNDQERWKKQDQEKADDHYTDGCEGCTPGLPGIIFPIAANGNEEHAWVHCCGECKLYESDLEAALVVGKMLGRKVVVDFHTSEMSACPYIDGMSMERGQLLMELLEMRVREIREIAGRDEGEKCQHEADWSTLNTAQGIDAVVSVNCRKCGEIGRAIIDHDDVNFGDGDG